MGASTFLDTMRRSANLSANQAFDLLAEDDRHENSHSYSGGIGMKHSFTHIATVDTLDEAVALADKQIGRAHV